MIKNFVDNNGESVTIGEFDTLKEAWQFKNTNPDYSKDELHIDRWEIRNDIPEPVEEIE